MIYLQTSLSRNYLFGRTTSFVVTIGQEIKHTLSLLSEQKDW